MSKILYRLIFVLIAVIVTGFVLIQYVYTDNPEDLSKANVDYYLSVDELLSAFEQDETLATEKFAGKVVEISGNVINKETDEWGNTIFSFVDQLIGVTAIVDSSTTINQNILIKTLNPGSQVKIRGRCDGMLIDVRLSKCIIIEEE